ncbi:CHAT domain-containing protein [Lewinella sp. W8]|uniref:CHAT domain-containing protein n=1 Tax=Lewinella sp. W8 TaxID=2528208 RepID=UPI001565E07A|nr:CHAT domain-containing tetratricopeptide repeat protein [Lewinella sp. W8]
MEEEKFVDAARAFEFRGSRADLMAAGQAWYSADSLSRSRAAYLSATQGRDGGIIVDSLTGLAYHKIGVTYYDEYNDARASHYYRRAIKIRDQVFSSPHNDRAKSRNNLATILRFLGNPDSAALMNREAIELYEKIEHPDTLNWLRSLIELSNIAYDLKDFQLANSASASAVNLLDTYGKAGNYDSFLGLYYSARINLKFRQLEKVKRLARRALALAEAEQNISWQADAINLLAGAYKANEEPEAAKREYQRALNLLLSKSSSQKELGPLYANLADMAAEDKNYRQALDYSQKARSIFGEHDPALLPNQMRMEGIYLFRSGNHTAALNRFNETLRLLDIPGSRNENGLVSFPPDSLTTNFEEAVNTLGNRAELLIDQNRPDEALVDYDALFHILDLLRAGVKSDASRQYLSSNLRPYFDQAIALLLELYREDPAEDIAWRALSLSERAKAYSLVAALQRSENEMPQREAELRRRIAELERLAPQDASILPQLEAARLQLDRLLRTREVDLAAFETRLDRQQLTQLIQTTQADLIAYHLDTTSGVFFHLSPSGKLSLFPIAQGTLDQLTKDWLAAIEQSAYRKKSLRPIPEQEELDRVFLQLGRQLSQALLPMSGENTSLGNRLIIIPDGALHFLPFAALPLGQAPPMPVTYGDLKYLQTGRTLQYTYSAIFLLAQQQLSNREYEHDLLAFAPTFRGASTNNQRGSRALPGLQPLRHNRPEVEAISSLIPDALSFYDEEANRQQFLNLIGKSKVVHLSSHGMVNASDPNLSFIAFSQLGDSLEVEEMLYFNDLYALPLNTELAVLSACETNLGTYVPGENVLSLASAFTAAGARSTLTTLWRVNDRATKELMVQFYEELAAGSSRAEALAAAQASHRDDAEFAHPYYWSALTLYGEAGPLALKKAAPRNYTYWLIPLLLALAAIGWRRLRARAKDQ